MNLGHCIGDNHAVSGNAAADALDIAQGTLTLGPRAPSDAASVAAAEAALGAAPRPVYCYVGCLHPGLGTVGLIFDQSCCDDTLQGVSKCDSGGLAGGVGPFALVPQANRRDALLALSYRDSDLELWSNEFDDEVTSSYDVPTDYARGDQPDISHWADTRARCLEAHTEAVTAGAEHIPDADRRLWTWEARLHPGPQAHLLRFVVLSDTQRDALGLDNLRRLGDLPDSIRIITGRSSAQGPEELFASLQVTEALVTT